MKKITTLFLAILFLSACDKQKDIAETVVEEVIPTTYTMQNATDSLSYAIGLSIGENFKQQEIALNSEALAAAIKELMDTTNTWDIMDANQYVQSELQKIEEEKTLALKIDGINFLAQNAIKPGVMTTASGLQYLILEEGTGAHPTAADQVTVHYTGTLIDGTVFDSSVERGQPATFGLNQVIKGWTEGIPLMKQGGKMRLFIPENLAYGPGRQGSPIPPYAALIFDVELISITSPTEGE